MSGDAGGSAAAAASAASVQAGEEMVTTTTTTVVDVHCGGGGGGPLLPQVDVPRRRNRKGRTAAVDLASPVLFGFQPAAPAANAAAGVTNNEDDDEQEETAAAEVEEDEASSVSGPMAFLVENSEFNVFVIETFLRVKAHFPSWYHNDLLSNLSSVYCPLNWTLLAPGERARYRALALEAAAATHSRRSLMATLGEDGLRLEDVTGTPLADKVNQVRIASPVII